MCISFGDFVEASIRQLYVKVFNSIDLYFYPKKKKSQLICNPIKFWDKLKGKENNTVLPLLFYSCLCLNLSCGFSLLIQGFPCKFCVLLWLHRKWSLQATGYRKIGRCLSHTGEIWGGGLSLQRYGIAFLTSRCS